MASETRKLMALAAMGIVLALASVELVVRLIEPREVLREFFETPDPVLHHRFIPGSRGRQKTLEFDAAYTINGLGLRDRELPREKPAGVRRILILGDSFTEGLGVDDHETFSSLLMARIEQEGHGSRWQVINAGVASYSPLLEYLYLKNGGLALEPDLVVLNLDLSDFYDDIQYGRLAELDASGDPIAVRPEPAPPPDSWIGWAATGIKDVLKYRTRTYNFVRRRIAGFIEAARHEPQYTGDVRVDKYGMLREELGPLDDSGWTKTYENILRIRDLLAARRIEFWIAVYPYGLQISPKEWHAGRQFWGFKPGQVYSGRPQERIEGFGQEHGIRVINMMPEFQEAARSVYPLYFDTDGHWLPAGHQVAASSLWKAIAPYIRDHDARARAGEPCAAGRPRAAYAPAARRLNRAPAASRHVPTACTRWNRPLWSNSTPRRRRRPLAWTTAAASVTARPAAIVAAPGVRPPAARLT
jgi:hypothetical protein